MAWKSVTLKGEEITIEVDPAVDLAGGKLRGLYICRARALTAAYVRRGSPEADIVLVSAATDARAIEKLVHAIDAGTMIRRPVPNPPDARVMPSSAARKSQSSLAVPRNDRPIASSPGTTSTE